MGAGCKGDQDINIAIRVKILAQGRTEKCKRRNVPAFTELGEYRSRNVSI